MIFLVQTYVGMFVCITRFDPTLLDAPKANTLKLIDMTALYLTIQCCCKGAISGKAIYTFKKSSGVFTSTDFD